MRLWVTVFIFIYTFEIEKKNFFLIQIRDVIKLILETVIVYHNLYT